MSIDQAIATLPRALSSYPDRSAGPLLAQLAERVRLEPFNAVATAIFVLAILHTFSPRRFTALAPGFSTRTTSGAGASAAAAAQRPRRGCCTSSAKSKSCSACGRSCCWSRCAASCRLGHGHALLQRHRQLHRAAVRHRDHGAGVDAPDHRCSRRTRSARWRASGGGTPGGVVGGDPDRRSAARLVHHRAGGDDDLRRCCSAASSTICSPRHAPEVRDAGPALRQRLDRRHADPLRGAAGADGGAAVGLGPPFMLGHFGWRAVVAIVARRCLLPRLPAGAGRAGARAAVAGRRRAGGRRGTAPPAAAGAAPGSPCVHVVFMAWTVFTAHYPALFVGGFLIFLGFVRRRRRIRAGST